MRGGIGAAVLAALLGAGVAVGSAGTAWAKPAVDQAGKATATVAPAVVYVEVQWRGEVRDRITGELYDPASIAFTTRCSGFLISTDGYLVTAGHCVDPGPDGASPLFFAALADRLQRANQLKVADRPAFLAGLAANAQVEGDRLGEPPVRTVSIQRGEVTPGRTSGPDVFAADVVDLHAPIDGDVALLKAAKNELPIAGLAAVSPLTSGTKVIVLGYPVDGPSGSVSTAAPSEVVNTSDSDAPMFYGLDPAARTGMEGGPVLDLNGQVVGLLTRAPGQTGGAPAVLSSVSLITDELTKNKVQNTFGKIDVDYRDGLNYYYDGRYNEAIAKFDSVLAMAPSHLQAQQYQQKAVSLRETEGEPVDPNLVTYAVVGGAVVLLVLILLVVLLLRRRRRSAGDSPPAVPPAAGPTPEPATAAPASTADPAVPPATGPLPAVPPPTVARFSAEAEPHAPTVLATPGTAAPAFSAPPRPATPVAEPPTDRPARPMFAEPVFAEPAFADQVTEPAPARPNRTPAPVWLQYCPNCGLASPTGTARCPVCDQRLD